MTQDSGMQEADSVTLRAARLYYEHDMTQQEVAEILGISRVKVTRLLAHARQSGLVSITVNAGDIRVFPELEQRVAAALELSVVKIAPSLVGDRRANAVAMEGARFLDSLLEEKVSVSLGASVAVAETIAHLPLSSHPDVRFTALTGGYAGPNRLLNPDAAARLAAAKTGGNSLTLSVPLVASSANLAKELVAPSWVQDGLEKAANSDICLIGIGTAIGVFGWDDSVLNSLLSEETKKELASLGAFSDISGRFFNEEGRALESSLDERVVGLSLGQMKKIPTRIAVAFGHRKVPAIVAAARGQLINVLVTDYETARELVEL